MIISDLNHCKEIKEVPSVVGGSTTFDFLKVNRQHTSVTQLGLSSAQAVSMFGDADSLALAFNFPNISQFTF